MDTVLLIDYLNFAKRADIKFKSKDGTEQNYVVVYNFFRNLRAIVKQLKPNRIFFCLEGKNNFRKKLFSEYKSNRIIKTGDAKLKLKENFLFQADKILALSSLLPITQCYADAFEADDVMYTLSHNLKDENVIIVSNDNDLWQILQEKSLHKIRIYDPFKKEFVVAPNIFYTVYKTLRGDTSDNIPRLVSDAAAEEMTGNPLKLKDFLSEEENKANFNLNLDLVRLRIIEPTDLQMIGYETNYNIIKLEFEKMEFNSYFKNDYWSNFINTFNQVK